MVLHITYMHTHVDLPIYIVCRVVYVDVVSVYIYMDTERCTCLARLLVTCRERPVAVAAGQNHRLCSALSAAAGCWELVALGCTTWKLAQHMHPEFGRQNTIIPYNKGSAQNPKN